MIKPILYAETSFWIRLVDREDPSRRRESRRLLRWTRGVFEIRGSVLVVDEMEAGENRERRRSALKAWEQAGPRVIPTTPLIRRIAGDLHLRLGRGEKAFADSTHLAYAIGIGASAVVTWDVADLAKPWTREVVRTYGRETGRPIPQIGTPREVREWAANGLI